jgi:hypothetical protein
MENTSENKSGKGINDKKPQEGLKNIGAFRKEKISILAKSDIDCLDSFFSKSIPEKKQILIKLGFDSFSPSYSSSSGNEKEMEDSDLNEKFEWILTQYEIRAEDLADKNTSKEKIIEPISPHLDIFKLGELSEESIKKLNDSKAWGNVNEYKKLEILKNAGIKKPLDFVAKSLKEKIEICVNLGWLLKKHLDIENSNKTSKLLGRMVNPINENRVNNTFFENLEKLSRIIEWELPPKQYLKDKEFENCESRFEKGSWVKNTISERKIEYNKYSLTEENFLGNNIFTEKDIAENKGFGPYLDNENIKFFKISRQEQKERVLFQALEYFKKLGPNEKIDVFKKLESLDEDIETLKLIFGPSFNDFTMSLLFKLMGNVGLSIKYLKKELLKKIQEIR